MGDLPKNTFALVLILVVSLQVTAILLTWLYYMYRV